MLEHLLLAASVLIPPGGQEVVDRALADASQRFAVKARLVRVERVTWRDGSLGCPNPDMAYTQALVPGWRIQVASGKTTHDYHASEKGRVVYCPPGHAKPPLPDSKT